MQKRPRQEWPLLVCDPTIGDENLAWIAIEREEVDVVCDPTIGDENRYRGEETYEETIRFVTRL